MKERNNNGKEILRILQENYELNTAQDLSSALKNMFKDALQEMMNAEFDTSMGYSKYDKTSEKTNYRNGTGNVSAVETQTITLDENAPTAKIELIESKETSITVKVSGEDTIGIDTERMYCKQSGGSQVFTASDDGTCIVTGLNPGTEYTVESYVYDLAGRQSNVVSANFSTAKKSYSGTLKGLINYAPLGLSADTLGGLERFYGACDATGGGCSGIVDNFICFGTDNPDKDCEGNVTIDYMYRIIGIDPNTGDMKLIKNTEIWEESSRRFFWHSSDSTNTEWPESDIYKRLNGVSSSYSKLFIDSTTSSVQYIETGNKWYNMIKNTNWLYGDIGETGSIYSPKGETNKTADEIYAIETGKQSTYTGRDEITYTWKMTKEAKIGLMYIHDYYYPYQGLKTTNCYSSSAGCKASWLHLRNRGTSSDYEYEWTMSRFGKRAWYHAWGIDESGDLQVTLLEGKFAVRPVFYLDASIAKITEGIGTYTDPFIVS